MPKVGARQGARIKLTDFGPVPSFLKQFGSNFLGISQYVGHDLKKLSSR